MRCILLSHDGEHLSRVRCEALDIQIEGEGGPDVGEIAGAIKFEHLVFKLDGPDREPSLNRRSSLDRGLILRHPHGVIGEEATETLVFLCFGGSGELLNLSPNGCLVRLRQASCGFLLRNATEEQEGHNGKYTVQCSLPDLVPSCSARHAL